VPVAQPQQRHDGQVCPGRLASDGKVGWSLQQL
jgi:hypothetical protein